MDVILSQTRGRGCGRNFQYHGAHSNNPSNSQKWKTSWNHQKLNNTEVKQENGKYIQNASFNDHENNCYICSMKRLWSNTCHTPKHLIDLYQASTKKIGKEIEMNFTNSNGLDLTCYDVDLFGGLSEKNRLFD